MRNKIILFSLLILLTGCATIPPVQQVIQSEETFPVPYDAVWEPLQSFFASGVTSVESTDKEIGLLTTKEFTVPYEGYKYRSKYVDCGELAGLTVYRKMIGKYDIFISKLEGKKVSVKADANYRAALYSGTEFKGWVTCQSRGYIEKLLFDDLRAKLKDYKETAPQDQTIEAEAVQKPEVRHSQTLVESTCAHILPSFRDDVFKKLAGNQPQ